MCLQYLHLCNYRNILITKTKSFIITEKLNITFLKIYFLWGVEAQQNESDCKSEVIFQTQNRYKN